MTPGTWGEGLERGRGETRQGALGNGLSLRALRAHTGTSPFAKPRSYVALSQKCPPDVRGLPPAEGSARLRQLRKCPRSAVGPSHFPDGWGGGFLVFSPPLSFLLSAYISRSFLTISFGRANHNAPPLSTHCPPTPSTTHPAPTWYNLRIDRFPGSRCCSPPPDPTSPSPALDPRTLAERTFSASPRAVVDQPKLRKWGAGEDLFKSADLFKRLHCL